MIKKVIAAVALVALFTVAMVQAMDKKEDKSPSTSTQVKSSGLEVGSIAPDFELKTLTGESVKLSDLRGKKVLLNFWATWCPPCKAEMPEMQAFYEETKDDVAILAVNLDPNNDVAGFAKEGGYTFPIVLDQSDEVKNTYGILSIPTTFFLDEKGKITHTFMGKMTIDDMKKYTK